MSYYYFVEILNANGDVQQRHRFTELPIRLGRSYNNDIILDDHHTAGEHAVIEYDANNNLVIRDLGSHNAIKLKGKTHSQVQLTGDTVIHLGHTHVRVRDSKFVVSAEISDATHHRWQGWPLFITAIFMIFTLSMSTSWLVDIANNKSSEYVISLAQWLLVAAVWSGVWALANRVFGGTANFTRHLFTLSCALAALTLLDYITIFFGFALSWEWVTRYQSHAELAIVALTIYYHLRHINPRKNTYFKVICVSLALIASSLKLMNNYQTTNQYADELYMHEVLPPAARISRNHTLAEFDSSIEKLKTKIDGERDKVLKEKAEKKPAEK